MHTKTGFGPIGTAPEVNFNEFFIRFQLFHYFFSGSDRSLFDGNAKFQNEKKIVNVIIFAQIRYFRTQNKVLLHTLNFQKNRKSLHFRFESEIQVGIEVERYTQARRFS